MTTGASSTDELDARPSIPVLYADVCPVSHFAVRSPRQEHVSLTKYGVLMLISGPSETLKL